MISQQQQLTVQTRRSLEIAKPHISAGRRAALIDIIPHVAVSRFGNPEHQKFWIALVGAESGYDTKARSVTGAVGLGQLIPSYRNDFGAACGLTGLDTTDVQDDFVNLNLSACYFNKLIADNGGDIALAMVSYKTGPFSQETKDAKAGRPVKEDTRSYIEHISRHKLLTEVREAGHD